MECPVESPSEMAEEAPRFVTIDVPAQPPAARGEAHGSQLRAEIASLWESWTQGLDKVSDAAPGSSKERALAYANEVWPCLREHAPNSAAEIEALAAAAGQPLQVIVALNCYDEIGLVEPLDATEPTERTGHCTGAAVVGHSGSGAIAGQNWACPLYYRPVLLLRVLAMGDNSGTLSEVHMSFPGIIAGPCMNALGLALTWFTVVPRSPRQVGLPYPVLLREASAVCSTVTAAMEMCEVARRCAGTCLLAADASGSIAQLEADATTCNIKVIDPSAASARRSFCAHANNYQDPELQAIDVLASEEWTTRRSARAAEVLRDAQLDEKSSTDAIVATLQCMLGDVKGKDEGVSICEHATCTGGSGETLSSVVFDPFRKMVLFKGGR